jgi:Fe-S-cluster containining protein
VAGTREALWLSCREKRCCSHYSVTPTAADLWRISRTFELPAWEFTRYIDARREEHGAFALDQTGRHFQIVLAKRETTCTFLFRLPDGHAQCALGTNRPTVCRAFPAALRQGTVRVGEHAGCTCGVWSDAALDPDAELALLLRLDRDRHEHAELIAEWNAIVARAGEPRTYPELCGHLMNAYASRHA